MDENEPGGYLVTTEGIIATDTDTTAELRFRINWDESYATKAGQEAPKELYEKLDSLMYYFKILSNELNFL